MQNPTTIKIHFYRVICFSIVLFYSVWHINLSAEIVGSRLDTEDNVLVILYNAQHSLHLLEIVDFIHEKKKTIHKVIYPHVALFVWDCEKRIDNIYDFWDSKSRKNRALRECNEDTEKMRAAMYKLQKTVSAHSRIKTRLDQLRQEVQANQSAYANNAADLQYEITVYNNSKRLQTALDFFIKHQNQSWRLLKKFKEYLSENPNKKIETLISHFQPDLTFIKPDNIPIVKTFLSSLKFLYSQSRVKTGGLFTQIDEWLKMNFVNSSQSTHSSIGSLLEIVNTIKQQSVNRINNIKKRKNNLINNENFLLQEIARNQNQLLAEWKKLTEHDHRKQLSFIESIPAFSISFKLHPVGSFIQ